MSKWLLKEKFNALQKMKSTLPVQLGNDIKNFALRNFQAQGFWDASIERWPKRKSKKDDKGRAILVKSGRLRRSIKVAATNWTRIRVGSYNVPYAKIHNEGGEISHKSRTSIMNFRNVDEYRKMGKNGKMTVFMGAKLTTKKKAKFSQKVSIGAYQSTMPQREFLGKSVKLSGTLRSTIIREMDKSFKAK